MSYAFMSHITSLAFCAECPIYPISCVPLSCATKLNDLHVTYMSCKPHTLEITCILWHVAVLSSYSTCKVILLFYSGTNISIIITMHNPMRPSDLWLQSFSLPLTQKHLLQGTDMLFHVHELLSHLLQGTDVLAFSHVVMMSENEYRLLR